MRNLFEKNTEKLKFFGVWEVQARGSPKSSFKMVRIVRELPSHRLSLRLQLIFL